MATDADLDWIAKTTGAARVRRAHRIQSLWGGYGEILRVELEGAAIATAIVKWVKPPRGRSDVSHARKCRSYDVETAWYRDVAARCDDECRVPALIGSRLADREWLFVLEDLDAAGFNERRRRPNADEVGQCLAWLAAFHARFLGAKPEGLWPMGTYWHLDTRREELAAIDDEAIRRAAPELDRKLRAAQFQTLVHGDAKPANFCFDSKREKVAAVDFQYVGSGCGMKDVAYLLSGERDEARYLDLYFDILRAKISNPALESEWRALYPVARADYARFLAGWAG